MFRPSICIVQDPRQCLDQEAIPRVFLTNQGEDALWRHGAEAETAFSQQFPRDSGNFTFRNQLKLISVDSSIRLPSDDDRSWLRLHYVALAPTANS